MHIRYLKPGKMSFRLSNPLQNILIMHFCCKLKMKEVYFEFIGPLTWFRLVGGQRGCSVTAYVSWDHHTSIESCTDLLRYKKRTVKSKLWNVATLMTGNECCDVTTSACRLNRRIWMWAVNLLNWVQSVMWAAASNLFSNRKRLKELFPRQQLSLLMYIIWFFP